MNRSHREGGGEPLRCERFAEVDRKRVCTLVFVANFYKTGGEYRIKLSFV